MEANSKLEMDKQQSMNESGSLAYQLEQARGSMAGKFRAWHFAAWLWICGPEVTFGNSAILWHMFWNSKYAESNLC